MLDILTDSIGRLLGPEEPGFTTLWALAFMALSVVVRISRHIGASELINSSLVLILVLAGGLIAELIP